MSGGTNLPQETKRSIYYTKRQRSRLYKKYPQFLVQVLPEICFGLRISSKFYFKKGKIKSETVVVSDFSAPISKSVRIVGESHRKRYLLIFVTFMAQLQEAHLEPIYSFCFSTQAFRPLLLQ